LTDTRSKAPKTTSFILRYPVYHGFLFRNLRILLPPEITGCSHERFKDIPTTGRLAPRADVIPGQGKGLHNPASSTVGPEAIARKDTLQLPPSSLSHKTSRLSTPSAFSLSAPLPILPDSSKKDTRRLERSGRRRKKHNAKNDLSPPGLCPLRARCCRFLVPVLSAY